MPIMSTRAAISVIACLFFVTGVRAEPVEWTCDRSPLLIKNVRIPGVSKAANILVSDGRIQSISFDATASDGGNYRIIDGAKAFAVPGLIDSHAHFDALPAAKHRQSELDVQTEIFP